MMSIDIVGRSNARAPGFVTTAGALVSVGVAIMALVMVVVLQEIPLVSPDPVVRSVKSGVQGTKESEN
jgi:hypothetical protein